MRSFAWWPTVIVIAVATFTDLRGRRIPNWLVFPFLLTGFAVSPWRQNWPGVGRVMGWHGVGQSFAGVGFGLLVCGFFFWIGGMGAGDVKLIAAIGAWIGPAQLLVALVVTGLAGGVMVLVWAVTGGFLRDLFAGAGDLVFGWKQRGMHRDPEMVLSNPLKRKMPYAPAIAVGTLFSFFAQ